MTMIIRRVRIAGHEAGYALAMVLGIGLVLMLMVVTATTYSISGFQAARSDQDWSAALSAAYAGVDEYQSRLTGDSSYSRFGNDKSIFTIATGSTVIAPLEPNPAFDVSVNGTWGTVLGSGGKASFRYEVDNSKFSTAGQLRVRATGKVGTETRSVIANIKGKGFIDFLYFTDYEISDPSLNLNDKGEPTCKNPVHAQDILPAMRPAACVELTFANKDTLSGPVHSNDIMHICEATFTDTVTSAYSAAPYYSKRKAKTVDRNGNNVIGETCDKQDFQGSAPSSDSTVVMPPSNIKLLQETEINNPIEVPNPGCLYTGPTSIKFLGNGTMRVKSPWTLYTQAGAKSAVKSEGVTLAKCGTPGNGANGLGSKDGAIVDVPNNNIVYVQAVPTTPGDANYTATGSLPAGFAGCYGSNPTTKKTDDNPARVTGNGIGYPMSTGDGTKDNRYVNEYVDNGAASYACRAGDIFVEGTVDRRVTLASANYIYITGDILYPTPDAPKNEHMLGLIGGKAVWVYNPIKADRDNKETTSFFRDASNRRIQAAILSVENTFTVQNYTVGSKRGDLIVDGAIAQKFRGAVATMGTTAIASGYVKKYSYDERLATTAPPKFLTPVATTYGVTSYADVPVGFTVTGVNK